MVKNALYYFDGIKQPTGKKLRYNDTSFQCMCSDATCALGTFVIATC